MDTFYQALANGVLLGGFYAVMVLGFSVIWGVMGVINLAHGEYLMIGSYLAWILFTYLGIDPFLSMLIIFPIMFFFGYLIQWVLINRIVERPHLMALLVTFGISISLANLVKLIYTADPRYINISYSGGTDVWGITFSNTKSMIFVASLFIMLGLHIFLHQTRLGKSIRAAAQNKNAARVVGIEINRVYAITAGICIALTGIAGAMVSLSVPVFPFMGAPFTLKAFTITALGGLGRIPGALLGGLLLGILESLVAGLVPGVGTTLGIAVSFIALVVVLIVRPQGLLQGLRPIDEVD